MAANEQSKVDNWTILSRRKLLRGTLYTGGLLISGACSIFGQPQASTQGSAKPATKDSLNVALFAEPSSLNPVTSTGVQTNVQVGGNIWNALAAYDLKTGQVKPDLATSWRQKDSTTWEFTLRPGVLFHKDFGELTADDVEFNVNYTVEQNKARKFLYFYVKGAKATGKYTVEVSLAQPFSAFIQTFAPTFASGIISKKAYDQLGEAKMNVAPIGTGPFMLDSWVPGSSLTLVKNDKYYKPGLPKLSKVTFRPVTDPVVKYGLIRTGEIDLMDNPDYKDASAMRQNSDLVVVSTPGWNWDYLTFNLVDVNPNRPWSKAEVRQAIAFAIDRDEINNAVFFGEGSADDTPIPNGFLGSNPRQHMYPNKADPEKAKALLRQAGYPNGFALPLMTASKPVLRREAQVIAGQLKTVGIDVQIENLDDATYGTRWLQHKYDGMALKDVTNATNDTDSSYYWFVRGNTPPGWQGLIDPALDSLLDQARAEFDAAKRELLYQQITRVALTDAPYIWTGHRNYLNIWRKGLEGFVPSPQQTDLFLETAYWAS